MPSFLPLDSNGHPIPAMQLKNGGAHSIAAGATSARNATAFDTKTKVISLYATVPVYIKTGGSSVAATTSDHYFPAGVYYDIAIGDAATGHSTHLAVLRAEGDGTVYISEKE